MDTKELRKLLDAATPGPWELWTSCSWRRFCGPRGSMVIEPVIQRSDNHPDLVVSAEDAALIIAMRNNLPELLNRLDAQALFLEAIEVRL